MGVISDFFLARRLRRGPTLLLPYAPDPATVLETVRLHDPQAGPYGRGFKIGENVELRGPIELTPELAARAGLPAGWGAAFFARTIDSEAGGDFARPSLLVRGLAERLGGREHPECQEPPEDLAEVTGGRPVPVDEVIGLLADDVPGLVVAAVTEAGTTLLTSAESPIEVFVTEWDADDVTYELSADGGYGTEVPAAARRAALAIAARAGGVARDHNGFLITQ
ncbi:hypothetical protein SAMN05421833_11753 [Microbispora rosea]|uniref:Uncharacterized protein n=1 Tax=Microbispora rosea TaxID=58117 RepID=A0A1N7EAW1_9ACTN|nr:hypothetical protein [Microbispora rosea]GIH47393.1 hypothetical protein Mro03_25720 [Microbispora rosea subsp. rosea]SIR85180.1 hypothetical protein SAMN05421833_11753 [Microbispora rosea]